MLKKAGSDDIGEGEQTPVFSLQGRHFSEANPIRLSDAKNRPEPTGICKQSF
jgi:hypothetical protein